MIKFPVFCLPSSRGLWRSRHRTHHNPSDRRCSQEVKKAHRGLVQEMTKKGEKSMELTPQRKSGGDVKKKTHKNKQSNNNNKTISGPAEGGDGLLFSLNHSVNIMLNIFFFLSGNFFLISLRQFLFKIYMEVKSVGLILSSGGLDFK